MAADNEERLLSAVVRGRDVLPLLERGVGEDWFANEESQTLYKFIRTHYTRYGEVPTAVTVKDNYPNVRLLKVEDSLEYLLDQFVAYRTRMATIDIVRTATDALHSGNDHDAALSAMRTGLAGIEDQVGSKGRDLDLTRDPMARLEAYKERAASPGGVQGLPIGIKSIDEITGGLLGGQLNVIIAPPKCGKTTLALQIANNLHTDSDCVPFFCSFEMGPQELESRHDSMRAHINWNRLRQGKLQPDEERRYEKMLASLEGSHQFILGDGPSASTISQLAAQVTKYDPDVIIVDGVYLMTDEVTGEQNTPQALTNLTRGLKRFAQKIDKPIIISTQTLLWKMKKNKVSADSIGYSSSFFQDADLILGLQRPTDDEDDPSYDTMRTLKIVAARNCGPGECDLIWDWSNGHFREDTGSWANG